MPKVTDRFGRPVSGQMPGLVEAIVVDNVDPDKLGRVKVKFPVLPDTPESYWARLVMPMAGQGRGWMTIPEVDDEVLVAFVHGDFNHAIVLGSLYNGVDAPPYANEDGDNNLRVFKSRSGHMVTFDDTEGAEKVELVVNNEEIRVTWDAAEMKLSTYCGGDISIEASGNVDVSCNDFTLDASGSISMSAGSSATIESSGTLDLAGDAMVTIKGAMVQIN